MLEPVPVLPVTVEQISIAKICDASAPNPAEMREGRRVSALVEHKMQPLAAALHWSAVMRRSQENELAQMPQPVMSFGSAIIASAPGYQPAHAVADHDQFLDRRRPLGDKHLQQISKSPPVGGNVQASVVMQIKWCVAQIARQRGAVIVTIPMPMPMVQAQAVHENNQPAALRCESLREAISIES